MARQGVGDLIAMGLISQAACDILGQPPGVGRSAGGRKVAMEKLPWEERYAEKTKTARQARIFSF